MPAAQRWLPLVLFLAGVPLAWGAWESRHADRLRAVVARGPAREAEVRVKSTRWKSGSKNSKGITTYWVILALGNTAVEREVSSSVYPEIKEGDRVPWYEDPLVPAGFSSLEISTLTALEGAGGLIGLAFCAILPPIWRRVLPGRAVPRPTHDAMSEGWPLPDRAALGPAWEAQDRVRRSSTRRLVAGLLGVMILVVTSLLAADMPGLAGIALLQGSVALGASAWILLRSSALDRVLWRDGRLCRGRVLSSTESSGWARLTFLVEAPDRTVEAWRWVPSGAPLGHGDPIPVLVLPGDPLRVAPVPPEAAA